MKSSVFFIAISCIVLSACSPENLSGPNSEATGLITLSGHQRVNQTVSASTEISDNNGTTNATVSYQWFANNVALDGETNSDITLGSPLLNQQVVVEVSFTDDEGYAESLRSEAFNVYDAFRLTIVTDNRDTISISQSLDNGESWSTFYPIDVSDEGYEYNYYPVIASDQKGNLVVATFSEGSYDPDPAYAYDYTLITSYSQDNGETWSPAVPLTSSSVAGVSYDYLDIAYDGNGNWMVVWVSSEDYASAGADSDIFYSVSTDNGVTWSTPLLLNSYGTVDAARDHSPVISLNGDHWFASWYSRRQPDNTDGSDYDVYTIYSSNAGVTWSEPVAMNVDAETDSDSDYYHKVDINAEGKGMFIYTGKDDGDLDIFGSYTTDFGANWSLPVVVNSDHAADALGYYACNVIYGETNSVAVWEGKSQTTGADNEAFLSYSSDQGQNWSPLVALNADSTTDSSQEHDVHIIENPNGGWLATYRDGSNEIYLTKSDDLITWTTPARFNAISYESTDWVYH